MSFMKKAIYLIFLVGLVIILGVKFFSSQALAYQIEDLNIPALAEGERGDFVLGPGKTELWLEAGDKFSKYLYITNRLGRTMNFKVEIEDFTGTYDPEETIRLLGEGKSPFSLKDFLKPEITEFILEHGQRMTLPIEISIPEDMEPGGLYGAGLISAFSREVGPGAGKGEAQTQIMVFTRLATLFFVRIKGDVLEEGFLKDFITPEKFYGKGPIDFQVLFENTGNVHISPYGLIEIKNLLGKKIDEIPLDAWFAMPDSLRLRETSWERVRLFGRYTATAKINRGYQDIIDEKTIYFWVIPWKIIGAGFIVLVLVIWFLKWIFSHFEIKRKRSTVSS